MISKFIKQSAKYLQFTQNVKTQFATISKYKTDGTITEIVNHYIDEAAALTNIPKDKMAFYKNCDSIIQINIPLRREDGTFETIKTYRIQHKTHYLPTKGGIIVHENVTRADIESFAVLNTIRTYTLDIPFGGAKGAICINPKKYTANELEIIFRKFTLEAAKKGIIGASVDVPGTDLGSTEREMNWIKDTYTTFFGQEDVHAVACVTGKGLNQGGLKGGVESTGYGVYYTIRELLKNKEFLAKTKLTSSLKGKTFIIEGYGNVGYWAAHFLQQAGAILIGVCEHDGQIYNPDGIDAEDIQAYLKETGGVTGYTKAKREEETAYQQCDIFIPCFFAQSINVDNADKFKCKIVAEGANLPTTPKAEAILEQKGIAIIPDVITSSGGFLASYIEWIKNINHTQHGAMTRKWEEKSNLRVLGHIEQTTGLRLVDKASHVLVGIIKGASERDLMISGIEDGFDCALEETIQTAKELGVNFRKAAYVNSLNKLHGHFEQVGITFSK